MKQENATKMTMLVIFAFLLSIGNVAAQADGVTFDFEDGDQGWRLLEGDASKFRVPVSKVDRSARIPATGKYVLAATGILESPVFRIDDSKAAFYVGGDAKPKTYVALHTEDGKEVRSTQELRNNALKRVEWDVSSLIGKRVFLRICAAPFTYGFAKRGGNLVFDNFNVKGVVDKEATARRAQRRDAEKTASIRSIRKEAGDLVFAVRKRGKGGHWYDNFGHWVGDPIKKLFSDGGSRLCRLNAETGEVETLFEDKNGGIRDPQVHYDGKKVLFSYRPGGSDFYNLYEMDLSTPGQLRRITNAEYDDIEPTYTAEGKIIFVSSRCKRRVGCHYSEVAILYTCNEDGSGVRQLSANLEHDNTPWPLPDGRILFTRWEYVERNALVFHHLWTTNPDGTRQQVFYGNMIPGSVMIDAKPIPNSNKVVSIFSPGHGRVEHAGIICLVDPSHGPDRIESVEPIGRDIETRDVYPIGEKGFIAAKKHSLTVVDYQGREEVIYSLDDQEQHDGYLCNEPRPITPRKRERIIPSAIDFTKPNGTLTLQDVYIGRNMKGIKRGAIKKLLVLEYLPKAINISNGSEPCGWFTFNHERILGTVPVEADGSASFEVPALSAIFLAALDENDLCIKRMQSLLTVQPGETLGCVGCHEERTQMPRTAATYSLAAKRPPSKITPIEDIPYVFDFHRDIQPIFDRHCVACHGLEKTEKGGPRSGGCLLIGDHSNVYSISYSSLRMNQQMILMNGNAAPYKAGSSASKLMNKIDGTHHGAKLSEHEQKMIRLWIDSGCIYSGTLAGEGTGMIYDKLIKRPDCYKWFSMPETWPSALQAANEVVRRDCTGCHELFNLDLTKARQFVCNDAVNLTRPEKALLLLAPLDKSAGGLGYCRKGEGSHAVYKSKSDPGYEALLDYMNVLKEAQDDNKRYNMPGFKPNEHYIQNMKRYGIIPANYDPKTQDIDVFKTDRDYWESVRWKPQ